MKVGIIGMGFMGATHLNAWRQVEGAHVTAICVRNPDNLQVKQGNIATGTAELNLDGISIYSELTDILAKESLDAVSITLPTHQHKVVSIQCLQAGLHVLCEKPMALNIDDCRAMTDAARAAGKELMIAHCIRFWPEYVWLKKAVQSGAYGKIQTAEFERLTYAPAWSGDSWFTDTSKSGGIALDLHIHDLDYIQYLFGAPDTIQSKKNRLKNGETGHIQTWLSYNDDLTVSATASWLMPESFGFQMAYKVVFEQAAVIFDGQSLKLYTDASAPIEPKLPEGDGYQAEVSYFAQRINGQIQQNIIPPEQAAESVRIAIETENA